MSTPTGLQSPPTSSDPTAQIQTIGKRKRSPDLNDAKQTNGETTSGQISKSREGVVGALLLDIFEVVKRFGGSLIPYFCGLP